MVIKINFSFYINELKGLYMIIASKIIHYLRKKFDTIKNVTNNKK